MLVSEMLEQYQREVVPEFKPRTQKDYAWIIGKLIAHFGHMDADTVKPKDVGLFLRVPTGKQSRNRMVAVLSAAYSEAVGRWFTVEKNPCLEVKRNPSKPRTRYITAEEFKIFQDFVPDPLKLAMELSYLTYQRQGDILALTWENVREDGIYIQQGKTGKKLLIRYTPTVRELLQRCRNQLPQIPRKFVIRRRTGQPYDSQAFKSRWIRYMNRAVKEGLLTERFTFHDLRAKACTDTDDLDRASKGAGHTNKQITQSVYIRSAQSVDPVR